MLTLHTTKQYRHDRNLCKKRGWDIVRLDQVIQMLLNEKPLEPKYHDHGLTGNFVGFRECHIQANWLLVYWVDGENLILTAARTGSHSDLF
jgi:mRNA interferase YafQ